MPEIVAKHRIDFMLPDSEVTVASIEKPAYIYKVGDIIRYFTTELIPGEDEGLHILQYEVIEVAHELQDVGGEQCIVVTLKEIKGSDENADS